jgi:hypothetical protein
METDHAALAALFDDRAGQVAASKRPERRGGWRGSAASMAALEEHRGRTSFGGSGVRTCKHCACPAVKGSVACFRHGGAAVMAKQGRLRPERRVNRRLRAVEAAGRVPRELAMHPAWIAARRRGWKAALVARELLAGWFAGGAAWVKALASARDAGLIG